MPDTREPPGRSAESTQIIAAAELRTPASETRDGSWYECTVLLYTVSYESEVVGLSPGGNARSRPGRITRGAGRDRATKSDFRQEQLAFIRIVVEDFGIAAPVNSGVQLPAGFIFAEVLFQNIVKEIIG